MGNSSCEVMLPCGERGQTPVGDVKEKDTAFCWKLSFFLLSHKLSLFSVGISVGFDLFGFGYSLSQAKNWICPQHKKCWIIRVPCCSLRDEYGNIQFQVM